MHHRIMADFESLSFKMSLPGSRSAVHHLVSQRFQAVLYFLLLLLLQYSRSQFSSFSYQKKGLKFRLFQQLARIPRLLAKEFLPTELWALNKLDTNVRFHRADCKL